MSPRSLSFIGGSAAHDRAYSRAERLIRGIIRRSTVLLYTGERSGNIIISAKAVSAENSNRRKNPKDCMTGGEEMTEAQEAYPQTLADEAHESVEPDLTKAEASKEIDHAAKPIPKASPRAS